jgi:ParB-like chromosome segregation protein Spo0J
MPISGILMARPKSKPPVAIDPSTWPASKVEMWDIEKIREYPTNPNRHSKEQIGLLARSMLDDGVTTPILVDEKGEIIYGHGRKRAALKNGFAQYPVVIARGWTEERKRSVRIKDNQLSKLSSFDDTLLAEELGSIRAEDLPLLGFTEGELQDLMAEDETIEGEAINTSVVRPGSRGVALKFDMMPADRDTVIAWLSDKRDKYGVRTTAEALIAMARAKE